MISPRALQMIERALEPVLLHGRKLERIELVVSNDSVIAAHNSITTRFGSLKIKIGEYVPKGYAYLLEMPGRKGRGFAWVSRPTGKEETCAKRAYAAASEE